MVCQDGAAGDGTRWRERILPRSFYELDAVTVARSLIGQVLVREAPEGTVAGRIVEAEAYCGPEDLACHARRGLRTPRNEVMYGPAGHAYVYFIYGMYYCLNVVAARPGVPHAVLVRAVEPLDGIELMARRRGVSLPPAGRELRRLASGPGRLTVAFGIDLRDNGRDLCRPPLYLAAGERLPAPEEVVAGRRVNVEYAGEWAARPWRFMWKANPYVSKGPS